MRKIVILGLIVVATTAFGFISKSHEAQTSPELVSENVPSLKGPEKFGYSQSNLNSW